MLGKHFGLWMVMLLLCSAVTARAQNGLSFDELVAKAAQAREQHDATDAISLYQQAVELNPKWAEGWWYLGSLQYANNDYAHARNALTHFIANNPTAGPAFALRGLCEYETGDYAQSLADLQRGLSLGAANRPENTRILRYHEAILLTLSGRFEEAMDRFTFFAQNGISGPDIFLAIGLAGLRMPFFPKDVPAAKQDLLLAAGRATWIFMTGNTAEAQQAFQDLFQGSHDAENVHYLYGYLLFPSDPDAAIKQFRQEMEHYPANASCAAILAWAYLIQNEPRMALPYAQETVEKLPSQMLPHLVLGKALVETGNISAGTVHLEEALKMASDNLEVHIALAKAYSKSGRSEDAFQQRLWCLHATAGEQHETP